MDLEMRTLWLRARNELHYYCRDMVRDGEAHTLEHAEGIIKRTHVPVGLTGDPKGGMMHNMERKVWWA